MERFSRYGILIARVMISMVFLLNALGVIDQNIPAREMMERGAPSALVPVMMLAGRSVELVAGMALIPGIFPRLGALALFAFLVPAPSHFRHYFQTHAPELPGEQVRRS